MRIRNPGSFHQREVQMGGILCGLKIIRLITPNQNEYVWYRSLMPESATFWYGSGSAIRTLIRRVSDPDPHGSAFIWAARSGSALNQCRSETLLIAIRNTALLGTVPTVSYLLYFMYSNWYLASPVLLWRCFYTGMTISGDGLWEVKSSSVLSKKRMVTPAGLGRYLN